MRRHNRVWNQLLNLYLSNKNKVVFTWGGILSTYKGRVLGSIGDLGCYSFHETKNISSGEGGALLVNNPDLIKRAEIIREKGTNRSQFFRGEIDKYTWVDIGSSHLPGEVTAAFLWAQMQEADTITSKRLEIWLEYHRALESAEKNGLMKRPIIPRNCEHNAHIYYILLNNLEDRTTFIDSLKKLGVTSVFHYVPLHSSPAGLIYGKSMGELPITTSLANRLVRLPMWVGLKPEMRLLIEKIHGALGKWFMFLLIKNIVFTPKN